MSTHPSSHRPIPAAVAEQASTWLARRDRGLTPDEQDAYMLWLAADAQHAEAMHQHAAALQRMMQLYEWQPVHTTESNPDLFAPRRRVSWWMWAAGLAAAAALAIGFGVLSQWGSPAPIKSHLRVNERVALPDGSRVELKDGSKIVVQYSSAERRVRLAGGEAQFSVWKDANRPFIVEAAGVEVRAVGTVFNVRLNDRGVDVLVTEGRVKVGGSTVAGEPVRTGSDVSAGERTTVPLAHATGPMAPEPPAVVTRATPEEIHESLAWQAPRLQFYETPLAEAVAEFNQLNREQIVIGDRQLGALRIGGTFRPDNVDAFMRLLGTMDIRAEKDGENRTVLRRDR